VTYYNAVQPLYRAYDGFMIQSLRAGSAPVAQEPLAAIPTPETVLLRTDSNAVAINIQSESDVLGGSGVPRQAG